MLRGSVNEPLGRRASGRETEAGHEEETKDRQQASMKANEEEMSTRIKKSKQTTKPKKKDKQNLQKDLDLVLSSKTTQPRLSIKDSNDTRQTY